MNRWNTIGQMMSMSTLGPWACTSIASQQYAPSAARLYFSTGQSFTTGAVYHIEVADGR